MEHTGTLFEKTIEPVFLPITILNAEMLMKNFCSYLTPNRRCKRENSKAKTKLSGRGEFIQLPFNS